MNVNEQTKINVEITPQAPLNVTIGECAKMDCERALNYIKSGEAEIEKAVQEGIEDFNDNAVSKTGDFNTNAVNKTNAFNQNAEQKQALIDEAAAEAAAEAKEWAIGSPEEPEEGSAKYWANQASSELSTLESDVSAIQAVIPAQASATNQLADKSFVNSSIATNTAYFIGTFNSVAELEAYSGTLTNNDYAFVKTTDTAGNTLYDRYKWNGSEWLFEYELNNSSFTAAQWAAINSGATAQKLANYVTTNTAQTIISKKTFAVEQKFNIASNTTTNGLSIAPYSSGAADIGLRDTSNNWLGRLFFNSSGLLQLSGTSVTSPTPTDNDTTSRQIDTVGARNTKINSVLQGLMPSGVILPFGGSSAPTGFLICDGSAVSRTTYSALFDVIGTAYGSGDGSTTFNLPNLSSGVLPSSSTVNVVGNGNALGIVDDISSETAQHNALVVGTHPSISSTKVPFSAFNLNTPLAIGSTSTATEFGTNNKALGVSTLPEWSGLTGSISGVSVNYIIKV